MALKVLHVFSRFDGLGASRRAIQAIDGLGLKVRHEIALSAAPAVDPLALVNRKAQPAVRTDFPALSGAPTPGRLQAIAREMKGADLVCTYDWGAIDAAMAHTLFRDFHQLAPLVHHEERLRDESAASPSRRRAWYRRVALGKASALVVADAGIEKLAIQSWQQPARNVHCLAPAVNLRVLARKPRIDALPRVVKREGELWLGCFSQDGNTRRIETVLARLASLDEAWQLIVLGDGPHRTALRDQAMQAGVAHRVHAPGGAVEFARVAGLFDLVEIGPGDDEVRLLEAMGAGLPVVADMAHPAAQWLPSANADILVEGADSACERLAVSPELRRDVGRANRRKAQEAHEEEAMVAALGRTWAGALGLEKLR